MIIYFKHKIADYYFKYTNHSLKEPPFKMFTSKMTINEFIACASMMIVNLSHRREINEFARLCDEYESRIRRVRESCKITNDKLDMLTPKYAQTYALYMQATSSADRMHYQSMISKYITTISKWRGMIHEYSTQIKSTQRKVILLSKQSSEFISRLNADYKSECMADRRWKQTMQKHWNQIRFAIYFRKIVGNNDSAIKIPALTFGMRLEESKTIMKLLQFVPSAFDDMMELTRTKLMRECPAESETQPASPVKQKADTTFAHALIKKNRFTFEYIVDDSDAVNTATRSRDVIFHESLEHIDPDYLTTIHKKMIKIIGAEPKKAISFSDHTVIYKNRAKTDFASVIHVYRTCHN